MSGKSAHLKKSSILILYYRARPSDNAPRLAWGLPSSAFPEFLRRDAQRAVELAGSVLPGDDLRQLYQGIVVVIAAQSLEQLICDLAPGDRHRVGVCERRALLFIVERAQGILGERFDLLVREPKLAAHGSVDVLSKLAAVKGRDATIEKRLKLAVNQT